MRVHDSLSSLFFLIHVFSDDAARHSSADDFIARFLSEDSPQKLHLPQLLVTSVQSRIRHLRTSSVSSNSSPSSQSVSVRMFDDLQKVAFDRLRAYVYTPFLDSPLASQLLAATFTVKLALTDRDKSVSACHQCLAPFGVLRRRHWCRLCGEVMCDNCVSKEVQLPTQFQITDPQRVCDPCAMICASARGEGLKTSHAFSFVATNSKHRPVNLAASSTEELTGWTHAIELSLRREKLPKDERLKAPTMQRQGWLMVEDSSSGSWRRHYCILSTPQPSQPARLMLFDMNLRGFIDLSKGGFGVTERSEASPTISRDDSRFGGSDSGYGYQFGVSLTQRFYHLAADNDAARKRWVDALRKQSSDAASLHDLTADTHPNDDATRLAHVLERAPEGDVAFVFTDVENSTKLWELAPEAMNVALEKHDELLRMLLKLFNGYEVKTEGDAFMVAFHTAVDALLWCLSVQRGLLDLDWPDDLVALPYASTVPAPTGSQVPIIFSGIRIRMGVHCGPANSRRNPVTGRIDYFGSTINRTARVSDSAHGGQIICTDEVKEQLDLAISLASVDRKIRVDDLGMFNYKGIGDQVRVWQVTEEALLARLPFPTLRVDKKKAAAAELLHDEDDAE